MTNKRLLNIFGLLSCVGLMAYALYSQHVLLLEPCPLCVFQRVAVIFIGIMFLIATLLPSSGAGRYVYAVLFVVGGAFGAGVAGRHIWLQSLPADQVPACGPGLDYMMDTFPFMETLNMVFQGSGECADVDWSFLGLSMPTWVLVWVVGLGVLGVVNNLRRG